MNFILPLFLMILAFIGGVGLTYAIMDAPRRQAKTKEAKLNRQMHEAREYYEELVQYERNLKDRAALTEKREAELIKREKRAVSYADLENENRLLRSELKNHTLHTAYLEHVRQSDRAGHTSVGDQRDQLGHAYFKEVAGWTRKSITTSNLPQSNQRVRTAAEWVRGCGVELTPEGEKEALIDVRNQFEKAVRAQEEREHQGEARHEAARRMRRLRRRPGVVGRPPGGSLAPSACPQRSQPPGSSAMR